MQILSAKQFNLSIQIRDQIRQNLFAASFHGVTDERGGKSLVVVF